MARSRKRCSPKRHRALNKQRSRQTKWIKRNRAVARRSVSKYYAKHKTAINARKRAQRKSGSSGGGRRGRPKTGVGSQGRKMGRPRTC